MRRASSPSLLVHAARVNKQRAPTDRGRAPERHPKAAQSGGRSGGGTAKAPRRVRVLESGQRIPAGGARLRVARIRKRKPLRATRRGFFVCASLVSPLGFEPRT